MRFAPPATVAFVANLVLAGWSFAEDNRYGGDVSSPASSSSFDFSGAFDGLPSSGSAVGGYRNADSTPPSSAAAPKPSAGNDLRPRSSASLPPSASTPSATSSLPTRSATLPSSPASRQAATSAAPSATLPRTLAQPSASRPATTSQAPVSARSSSTPPAPPYASSQSSQSSSQSSSTSSLAQRTPSAYEPSSSSRATASTGSSLRSSSDLRSYAQPSTSPPASSRSATPTSRDLEPTRNRFESPSTSGLQSQAATSVPRDAETADPQAGVRERRTREILEKMLRPRSESRLSGTPVSLASVIASAATREEQSQRVEAYWALTSATADYYLGLAEVGEIAGLSQGVTTYSTALSEAQTNLNTRINTSLKAARAAQLKLSQLMGGGVTPLPADTPFTGPYATRFESVFAGGAPEEARLINELLPLRLAELQDAADSVARSQQWVERVANEPSSGADGTGVIKSFELLALNRRAFVQIARDYNLQINRYTQLAAPERVDTGRLVAMLIRTPNAGVQSADDALMAGFSAGATSSASRENQPGAPARR